MLTNWPADRVERRRLDALVLDPRNARTHSAAQVAQIAASMQEWGWTNPILVDDGGTVIAGHGRVLAAGQLGWVEAPVMVAAGWTEAQKRAYLIADNQLALNAGWDVDMLAGELRGLAEWDFDLSLLGFADLDALLARGVGLTDPDAAPPLPVNPVSVPGDVWQLGRHRLVCGDSTNADTVAQGLNGVTPHLMVTDPPYGVGYNADWRNKALRADGSAIGGRAIGKVENDHRADWRNAWALFQGSVVYVWHGGLHGADVYESLQVSHFTIRAQIVWVKTRQVISRGHYHWQHEPCLYGVRDGDDDQWRFIPEHEIAAYAVKDGKPAEWQGSRKQSTVWFIEHIRSETGHSSQKPVDCMKRPIENNSAPGQAVYDPFVGSGTTIIAAEMTGRACHAIELSPAYVDVSVRRWQDFTGKTATLDGDGRPFDVIADERQPYDADADSIGSYNAAVAAIGERVKAGATVPEFMRSRKKPRAA
jgi:DNA modification methylase